MPSIEFQGVEAAAARWAGACPAADCPSGFDIEADPWQGRISVLSELTGFPRAEGRHLHGLYVVFDDFERGGE